MPEQVEMTLFGHGAGRRQRVEQQIDEARRLIGESRVDERPAVATQHLRH